LAEIPNGVQVGANYGTGNNGYAAYIATASSSDARCVINPSSYTYSIGSTASTGHSLGTTGDF